MLGSIIALLILLGVVFGIFLICREIILWYWKVNEIVSLLEAINKKLGPNEKSEQEPNKNEQINKDKTVDDQPVKDEQVAKQTDNAKEEVVNEWICSKCGAKNDERMAFCYKCRKTRDEKQKEDLNSPNENKWVCRRCGAENGEKNIYCSICGKQKQKLRRQVFLPSSPTRNIVCTCASYIYLINSFTQKEPSKRHACRYCGPKGAHLIEQVCLIAGVLLLIAL